MKSRALFLVPCSSSSASPTSEVVQEHAAAEDGAHTNDEGCGGGAMKGDDHLTDTNPPPEIENGRGAIAQRSLLSNKKKKKKRGVIISKPKKAAGASSSSSISASNRGTSRRPKRWDPHSGDDDSRLEDLAFPLGMAIAAFVSQVLDGINGSRDNIPIDRLSLIYGNKFEYFLLNFEKSFGSTLRTLRLINEASSAGHGNGSSGVPTIEQGNRLVSESSTSKNGNISCSSFLCSNSCEVAQGNDESFTAAVDKLEDAPSLTSVNNQIVLHGQMNRELALASRSFAGPGSSQSILGILEKSVVEQTRSNDLKEREIGLISRKLQLKESQLALGFRSYMVEKIKISIGISKASFKKEKLRNQMLDKRHAEFLARCMDLLVAGLIIMSGCLCYGAYIYSYQHITEATSSCYVMPKESKSWWIPKSAASFSSGWHMLSCHVVALSRMFFGLAMIVAIAYSVFQRSSVTTTRTMPVTSILLLGILCGIAGKLCVDTLGGSGIYWLLNWETLCFVHFFASVFPSVLYQLLYGPVCTSQIKAEGRLVPYWLRRFMFNVILAIAYPAMTGLLPFASLGDWKEHFSGKIDRLIIGVESHE